MFLENQATFTTFGPQSLTAQEDPGSNLHLVWKIQRLTTIVKNNSIMMNALKTNSHLLSDAQSEAYQAFRAHALAYEHHVYEPLDRYPLFPESFEAEREALEEIALLDYANASTNLCALRAVNIAKDALASSKPKGEPPKVNCTEDEEEPRLGTHEAWLKSCEGSFEEVVQELQGLEAYNYSSGNCFDCGGTGGEHHSSCPLMNYPYN